MADKTRIEIILGPMFSGKSTELCRRVERYDAIGMKIFIINHDLDNRTDDSIKTHSGKKLQARKASFLKTILDDEEYLNSDVVGIDEAQFFPDLFDFIKIAERHNKIFIIAGLDGNYKREPMGDILRIIPYSDSVVKISAMDMEDKDGSEAIFTKRIVDSESPVLVGAQECYKAVSRKNYLKE